MASRYGRPSRTSSGKLSQARQHLKPSGSQPRSHPRTTTALRDLVVAVFTRSTPPAELARRIQKLNDYSA